MAIRKINSSSGKKKKDGILKKNHASDSFLELKGLFLDSYGLKPEQIWIEKEGGEYGACRFELNNRKIVFRMAKITPTKAGQFVTLWKRRKDGPTEPYHIKDDVDYFIIAAIFRKHSGQFIFPKSVLHQLGILSGAKEGKRGFRIYPPWDVSLNKQANQTQIWQSNYFLEKVADLEIDRKNFLNRLGLGE
ncbi:MepB family protein [Leptospira stimsonii]|uniref:MepB protein n=1 Tax=Leptospira stimsonii TaxID=2202203 RepID=A0A396YZY4_9LEPT|nr:MepB family protein [Leptospira stimsonii]RHX87423.1 MepB protein [Leptospira stimsonii]